MKEKRLPQNSKEGILYGGTICLVTVIVMLILNVGTEMGKLDATTFSAIITLIPIIWIVAMLLETLVVGRIAKKLVEKFTEPTDGFNTKILFNIIFCVTGMSIIMTIVGAMIGKGQVSIEPFIDFPQHWPRNFCVAFWCEILLAQPIARAVMKFIHKDKKEKAIESTYIDSTDY